MSLMRLLAAGRSLIGGEDRANRYRLPRRKALPTFGGEANPFASTVRPGGKVPNAAVEVPVAKGDLRSATAEAGRGKAPRHEWLAWIKLLVSGRKGQHQRADSLYLHRYQNLRMRLMKRFHH